MLSGAQLSDLTLIVGLIYIININIIVKKLLVPYNVSNKIIHMYHTGQSKSIYNTSNKNFEILKTNSLFYLLAIFFTNN